MYQLPSTGETLRISAYSNTPEDIDLAIKAFKNAAYTSSPVQQHGSEHGIDSIVAES